VLESETNAVPRLLAGEPSKSDTAACRPESFMHGVEAKVADLTIGPRGFATGGRRHLRTQAGTANRFYRAGSVTKRSEGALKGNPYLVVRAGGLPRHGFTSGLSNSFASGFSTTLGIDTSER
jgi:hypothetical protein